jgi:hypothetical protein
MFWTLPGVLLLAGCGPVIPKEDLGTPVFAVPTVPGADKPYNLPDDIYPAEGGDTPAQT